MLTEHMLFDRRRTLTQAERESCKMLGRISYRASLLSQLAGNKINHLKRQTLGILNNDRTFLVTRQEHCVIR